MIKNAVIVGCEVPMSRYCAEEHPRGSSRFTVRAHVLAEILRNPQRWVRGYVSPESKALKFGTVLDCLVLTPKLWHKTFAVVPADAPKQPTKSQLNAKEPSPKTVDAIEYWKQFRKNNPGEILDQQTNGIAHAAASRLFEDKLIAELINCSAKQMMITAEWHDRATGLEVPLKCLIDIVPPPDYPGFSNSLWDLKTTQNASPNQFTKDAQRFSYHVQGAFYLDLFNAATGEMRADFGHVIIESYFPYEYRTPPPLLSQRFLDFGRLSYQSALATYCKGLATGQWPSYDRKSNEWPKTDCYDSFLNMESILSPIEDLEEESETDDMPEEETEDVTP